LFGASSGDAAAGGGGGAAAVADAATASAAPPALASGWSVAHAADGQTYYYNAQSRRTRWDPPPAEGSVADAIEERRRREEGETLARQRRAVSGMRERAASRAEESAGEAGVSGSGGARLAVCCSRSDALLVQNILLTHMLPAPPRPQPCPAASQVQKGVDTRVSAWAQRSGQDARRMLRTVHELLPADWEAAARLQPATLGIAATNTAGGGGGGGGGGKAEVKKAFMKVVRVIHPDKLPKSAGHELRCMCRSLFVSLASAHEQFQQSA
jgi:hypothetical protein